MKKWEMPSVEELSVKMTMNGAKEGVEEMTDLVKSYYFSQELYDDLHQYDHLS